MKKLLFNLILLGLALNLTACNDGGGPAAQNMPIGGVFNMTLSPGIYSAINSGNGCVSTENDSGFLYPESNISYGTNNSTPLNGILYYGTFSNPINQNNPCFTGTVGASDPINGYPAIPSGCANANNGTLQFYGCSVLLVGNHYQFNATYKITQSGGAVLLGTVSGQQ